MRNLRTFFALCCTLLLACGEQTAPDQTEPPFLTVLSVNVGNLDELNDGPCPVEPYYGGLCSLAQEQVIAASIAALKPDIAYIFEVVDSELCPDSSHQGDPDLICTDAPNRSPQQSVRRLLGPDYTISCDDTHFTCIGVRSDRITVAQCDAGALCMGGSETGEHPAACGALGSRSAVSRLDATLEGAPLTLVAAHPINAIAQEDDPCRLAHYQQLFEQMPKSHDCLIGGDMNMDPYRFPDLFPSGEYWHTVVGPEHRFQPHNLAAEGPPLPTWANVTTLDYVLSDFLAGDCQVLGVSEGTERIDGELSTMDHRALWCELSPAD